MLKLCQDYAPDYAKIMPCMLKLCFYAPCQNHSNCIMLKLCSFMLKYANYAKIMPIMLYAPAMLLCQFLCWHNPLDPRSSTSVSDASGHLRLLPRFGMRSATHRQRWGTRGPTLSWVSRCAPAACGEGVTLRSPCQRCSTPTHSCSTRARRCCARRPHARAPPCMGSVHARARGRRARALTRALTRARPVQL